MSEKVKCGHCGREIATGHAKMARGFEPVCSEFCRKTWDREYPYRMGQFKA